MTHELTRQASRTPYVMCMCVSVDELRIFSSFFFCFVCFVEFAPTITSTKETSNIHQKSPKSEQRTRNSSGNFIVLNTRWKSQI